MSTATEEQKPDTPVFIPPKKKFTLELLVGIFAIIGLGSFAYLAINIAQLKLSNSGFYQVNAIFNSISGLKPGAPVEIAGVEIGEVANITLDPDTSTQAVLTLNIRDGIKLRDDDVAAIRTKGIIGDRYIKIVPGGSDLFIKSGQKIGDTESAVEFEEIIGKLVHRFENQ